MQENIDDWVIVPMVSSIDRGFTKLNIGASDANTVDEGPSKGTFNLQKLTGLSAKGGARNSSPSPSSSEDEDRSNRIFWGEGPGGGGDTDEEEGSEYHYDSDYDIGVDVVSSPVNIVTPTPAAVSTQANALHPTLSNFTVAPPAPPGAAAVVPMAASPQPAISPLFFQLHGGEYDTLTVSDFRRIPEQDLHPDLQGRFIKTTIPGTTDQYEYVVSQIANHSRPWAEALQADPDDHLWASRQVNGTSLSDEALESISGPLPQDLSIFDLFINPVLQ